jgi:uncharacterized membrane protein YdjX (TVP38/TMEM64 family)
MTKLRVTKPIIFTLICIVGVLIYTQTNLNNLLTIDFLRMNQTLLMSQLIDNYWWIVTVFMLSYVIITTCSLPFAALMSVAGGAIFGLEAGLYVVISAAFGALCNMLIIRYFLRGAMEQQFSKQSHVFNSKIEQGVVSYLLFVHLLPVFPFFLINILAGLSRVKPFTFFWTTLIGIIPGSMVYVYSGTQLSKLQSIDDIISPQILFTLVLLSLFSLIPKVILKSKTHSSL